MGALFALVNTPIGRRILLAAGILAALGIIAWHFHHVWTNEGKEQQRTADVQDVKQALDQQQKTFEARLDRDDAKFKQMADLVSSSQATVQTAIQAIHGLELERRAAAAQVATVPDAGLVADLRIKLNAAPQETSPILMPIELRAADVIVTDYPLLKKENEQEIAKSAGLADEVTGLEGEVAAIGDERDAAFGWADELLKAFRIAYNAVPTRRRAPACLWIWNCGAGRKLPIPKPDELLANRPKEK